MYTQETSKLRLNKCKPDSLLSSIPLLSCSLLWTDEWLRENCEQECQLCQPVKLVSQPVTAFHLMPFSSYVVSLYLFRKVCMFSHIHSCLISSPFHFSFHVISFSMHHFFFLFHDSVLLISPFHVSFFFKSFLMLFNFFCCFYFAFLMIIFLFFCLHFFLSFSCLISCILSLFMSHTFISLYSPFHLLTSYFFSLISMYIFSSFVCHVSFLLF